MIATFFGGCLCNWKTAVPRTTRFKTNPCQLNNYISYDDDDCP